MSTEDMQGKPGEIRIKGLTATNNGGAGLYVSHGITVHGENIVVSGNAQGGVVVGEAPPTPPEVKAAAEPEPPKSSPSIFRRTIDHPIFAGVVILVVGGLLLAYFTGLFGMDN